MNPHLEQCPTRKNPSQECTHMYMHHIVPGDKYGHLQALKPANKGHQKNHWLWQCDCGRTVVVVANKVCSGHRSTCAHKQCEFRAHDLFGNKTKGGFSKRDHPLNKLYVCGVNAQQRCQNPNNPSYSVYGGRGIEFRFANPTEFAQYCINEGIYPFNAGIQLTLVHILLSISDIAVIVPVLIVF